MDKSNIIHTSCNIRHTMEIHGNTLRTKPWPFRSSCWAYQKNLSSTVSQPTENINGISIYIYPFNKAKLGASSVLILHHLPGVPTLKRENLRVLELQPMENCGLFQGFYLQLRISGLQSLSLVIKNLWSIYLIHKEVGPLHETGAS